MAMLIGSERSENYGEKLFYDKASQYFDDTYIIYRNRQLYGREFDACIRNGADTHVIPFSDVYRIFKPTG